MDESYTHITIILDRTGSMESIRDDTIGGFNVFLREQQDAPGEATMSLVQFDSQDPYEVIQEFTPIADIDKLHRDTYVPRAATPLLDAVGRGINDLDQQLGVLTEDRKPAKVVFAIVTDGKENASREFSREQIMKMIDEKQEKDIWQFVFLSADLAAIREARDVGFMAKKALQGLRALGVRFLGESRITAVPGNLKWNLETRIATNTRVRASASNHVLKLRE
jgi:hypothetical protein